MLRMLVLFGFCCSIVAPSVFIGSSEVLAAETAWTFTLNRTEGIHPEPFTGRVYLFFSEQGDQSETEPRLGPNWFRPQPMISYDVTDWKSGDALQLSLTTPGLKTFPAEISNDTLTNRRVQAIARFNPIDPNVGTGSDNGRSDVIKLDSPGEVTLTISSLTPKQVFPEEAWSMLLRVRSKLLSDFHGRDVYLQGAVTVPASYDSQPDRRYPVILEVPGFGGDHFYKLAYQAPKESNTLGVEFIRVMLDPRCPLGHHVFANSANNGSYGNAFVQEFLPALDEAYRTAGAPGRFLTGHSSGGWSTIWLQMNYPQHFAGTWSTAPDPVDFRNFQNIVIHRPGENMYVDPEGNRRPLGRMNGEPVIFYDTFSHMEEVLGHGGQLCSFDAVFSPRGANGQPLPLWNRETGVIDPAVAEAWKKYDLRQFIEEHWEVVGPQLQGKLNVFMGTEDTFYLEGAAMLLKESLEKLGSDAVVEFFPGADHWSFVDSQFRSRMEQEMAAKFLENSRPRLQNQD
ncbi:MAG TPA: alpha/beta hydrolase-fold protein [Planctomicrobium sp.]|nr:alpha/beta hydrolase-fold protein [Planctomicrobium sp.]